MSPEEKELAKRWFRTWETASVELEKIKRNRLNNLTDDDVVFALSIHNRPKTLPKEQHGSDLMHRESVILAGWYTKFYLMMLERGDSP